MMFFSLFYRTRRMAYPTRFFVSMVFLSRIRIRHGYDILVACLCFLTYSFFIIFGYIFDIQVNPFNFFTFEFSCNQLSTCLVHACLHFALLNRNSCRKFYIYVKFVVTYPSIWFLFLTYLACILFFESSMHWSLAIICIPAKEDESGLIILHLDSLGLHSSSHIFSIVGR